MFHCLSHAWFTVALLFQERVKIKNCFKTQLFIIHQRTLKRLFGVKDERLEFARHYIISWSLSKPINYYYFNILHQKVCMDLWYWIRFEICQSNIIPSNHYKFYLKFDYKRRHFGSSLLTTPLTHNKTKSRSFFVTSLGDLSKQLLGVEQHERTFFSYCGFVLALIFIWIMAAWVWTSLTFMGRISNG